MAVLNDIDGLAKIKVIGVGGGGCNAVSRMVREKIYGVEFLATNTDAQALMRCEAPVRLRMGDALTRGLGVGGDPDLGRQAAAESHDDLYDALKGADMVFIAAGMGGGTGTGAASVIAEISKETGALTIAVVTTPFAFEGMKRSKNSEEGLRRLRDNVDTLIVIPNDRLIDVCDNTASYQDAFKQADDVLRQGIQSIAELITIPGEINLDFADVKAIMGSGGQALMAIGRGEGENRAAEAARAAISNPLLDVDITGAKGVLFNITGGVDLGLSEIHAAADVISNAVDPEANIIFGVVPDSKMEGEVKITLIATGFDMASEIEHDDQMEKILASAFADVDLDIPPFLRRRARRNGRS